MDILLSSTIFTALLFVSSEKLGQPVNPGSVESYFESLLNKLEPQAAQVYMPFLLWFKNLPEPGASVPFWRSTLYCSGVSLFFQSLFCIANTIYKDYAVRNRSYAANASWIDWPDRFASTAIRRGIMRAICGTSYARGSLSILGCSSLRLGLG